MAKTEKDVELLEEDAPKKTSKLKVEKPSVDWPVGVIATDADPYHETGHKFQEGSKKAAELVKRGWVKMAMIALLLMAGISGYAQTSVDVTLKNYQYTTLLTDTVTNTGVGAVTSARISGPAQGVTIAVVLTEISGTTAGTLTLQGSLDGTNFKAIPTEETQTSIATATALDVASQVFTWRIKNSPYLYYRVSWTGTGTMSATIAGRLMKH